MSSGYIYFSLSIVASLKAALYNPCVCQFTELSCILANKHRVITTFCLVAAHRHAGGKLGSQQPAAVICYSLYVLVTLCIWCHLTPVSSVTQEYQTVQKATERMTIRPNNKSLSWLIRLAMFSHFSMLQRTRGRQIYRGTHVAPTSGCHLPDPHGISQPQECCETIKFSLAFSSLWNIWNWKVSKN